MAHSNSSKRRKLVLLFGSGKTRSSGVTSPSSHLTGVAIAGDVTRAEATRAAATTPATLCRKDPRRSEPRLAAMPDLLEVRPLCPCLMTFCGTRRTSCRRVRRQECHTPRSPRSARVEDRDREGLAVCRLLAPGDTHRHPALNFLRRTALDVGGHPHAFIEIDQRDDVGHTVLERGQIVLVNHGEGMNGSIARRLPPLRIGRPTPGASGPRIEERLPTRAALLIGESSFARGLPIGRGLRVGLGEVPGRGFGHHSTPRTSVPVEENHPPVPFTAASRAPFTWRPVASPRSCRTASTMRNTPRIPGWFEERPPPSVFVGSFP